jgi:IclR family transcriptional regulator, KDG regulon repressor
MKKSTGVPNRNTDSEAKKLPRSGSVNSIVRAINIMKSLRDGSLRVVEISEKLGLNKSTVYRLLKTLEDSGFIAQDAITRKYYLGTEIISLASSPIVANEKLVLYAQQEMIKLCNLSRETVILEIQFGTHRMYLEAVESIEPIRYRQTKGYFAPLFVGAGGKALLSQLTRQDLENYLRNVELTPAGPNAILDKKLMLKEIEKVAQQGYAVSARERTSYGSSISVPIKNYAVPAALSIVGPADRWKPKMLSILDELKAAADRISKRLSE